MAGSLHIASQQGEQGGVRPQLAAIGAGIGWGDSSTAVPRQHDQRRRSGQPAMPIGGGRFNVGGAQNSSNARRASRRLHQQDTAATTPLRHRAATAAQHDPSTPDSAQQRQRRQVDRQKMEELKQRGIAKHLARQQQQQQQQQQRGISEHGGGSLRPSPRQQQRRRQRRGSPTSSPSRSFAAGADADDAAAASPHRGLPPRVHQTPFPSSSSPPQRGGGSGSSSGARLQLVRSPAAAALFRGGPSQPAQRHRHQQRQPAVAGTSHRRGSPRGQRSPSSESPSEMDRGRGGQRADMDALAARYEAVLAETREHHAVQLTELELRLAEAEEQLQQVHLFRRLG
jgi:hypothetical protein